jgi:predicted HicB family RNase H-like nuclease
MPVSKANIKAVSKYMKANYDELKIRVPKGRKNIYMNHATAAEQSLNGYVIQAVDERIERERSEK